MTAKEMIGILSTYPPEAPIVITWEGVVRWVLPSNVYTDPNGTIFIDGDLNLYKEYVINNPGMDKKDLLRLKERAETYSRD